MNCLSSCQQNSGCWTHLGLSGAISLAFGFVAGKKIIQAVAYENLKQLCCTDFTSPITSECSIAAGVYLYCKGCTASSETELLVVQAEQD